MYCTTMAPVAREGDYRSRDGYGEPIPCGCGCGVLLRPLDGYKRERRFIRGHWMKWALKSYSRSVDEYLKTKGDLE